jgi:hypothetical protein
VERSEAGGVLKPAVHAVFYALRNAHGAPCPSVFLPFAGEYEDTRLVYEQPIDRVLRKVPGFGDFFCSEMASDSIVFAWTI